MVTTWFFTIMIHAFCALGSHYEYRDIAGFHDKAECERVRAATPNASAVCEARAEAGR